MARPYTPERYYSRGRFSMTKFKEECIHEYAEVFPVGGGDFSFYAASTPEFWQKLFSRSARAEVEPESAGGLHGFDPCADAASSSRRAPRRIADIA